MLLLGCTCSYLDIASLKRSKFSKGSSISICKVCQSVLETWGTAWEGSLPDNSSWKSMILLVSTKTMVPVWNLLFSDRWRVGLFFDICIWHRFPGAKTMLPINAKSQKPDVEFYGLFILRNTESGYCFKFDLIKSGFFRSPLMLLWNCFFCPLKVLV